LNIILQSTFFIKKKVKTLTNYYNSITRNNISFNDTLLLAFKNCYNLQAIKFQSDIHRIAYVLNLVVQNILKIIIKNDYSDLRNTFNTKNNKDFNKDIPSKFYFKLSLTKKKK
jgi:hypothetical protein